MTVKAYKKKCERIKLRRQRRGINIPKIKVKQRNKIPYIKPRRKYKKLSIRERKQVRIEEHKIKRIFWLKKPKVRFYKYFERLKVRKHNKRKKYRVKRHDIKRVQVLVKKIFEYPDRISQPKWVKNKISYMLSFFSMYNYIYRDFLQEKDPMHNLRNQIYSSLVRKKRHKTYTYNNAKCTFVVKPLYITKAKKYKIYVLQKKNIFKTTKNLLWKIMCRFYHRYKRNKKIKKRIYFKLKMLNNYERYKKYNYRKHNLYRKKNNRKIMLKKVKMKINNKITTLTVKMKKTFVLSKMKNRLLINSLFKLKKKNYHRRRIIRKTLHNWKRKFLSVNAMIMRKKRRKYYWLTHLRLFKHDIKTSFCFNIIYKPLILQRLLNSKMYIKKISKAKNKLPKKLYK